jgi:RNA polymerase sigma-70 factor (ECF subfamily)
MFGKKPPTRGDPRPYKERMELIYSEARRREEVSQLPDRDLALQARAGDMVAFESLVLRKTPSVVSVARRIVGDAEDARDVAQMTFLRVWEQLARYDEAYSFNTWLYRIATNLAIDFLRSARSRARAHTATLHLVRAREDGTASETTRAAEDDWASRLFQRVSGRLSGKQKAAFVLRELEDLETAEIAQILDCGESTVRNHLFNARRILRREVERVAPLLARRRRASGPARPEGAGRDGEER